MGILRNKIDFVAFAAVAMANPNGDPLNGNSPRTDYAGLGEMSDVCIKRKLRNRMQDLGQSIFVQSPDHNGFDQCKHLKERATKNLGTITAEASDVAVKKACGLWMDVRAFGQVFALGGKKKGKKADKESMDEDNQSSVSIGIRGPVTIHQATSLSPVQVEDMQITKCVNGDEPKSGKPRSSDTMGMKHFVRFGLYKIKGSINVQLAEKTGFTEEDAETLKECLRTLFVNDASSARPDGSMEVCKLYWFQHNCPVGQHSSANVHRSVHAKLKDSKRFPTCPEDYQFTVEPLEGLEPEVLDGV